MFEPCGIDVVKNDRDAGKACPTVFQNVIEGIVIHRNHGIILFLLLKKSDVLGGDLLGCNLVNVLRIHEDNVKTNRRPHTARHSFQDIPLPLPAGRIGKKHKNMLLLILTRQPD